MMEEGEMIREVWSEECGVRIDFTPIIWRKPTKNHARALMP